MTAPGLRPICDYGRCQQILAGFAQVRDKLVADQARTASGWLADAIDRAGLDDVIRERLMDALRQVLAEAAGERERAA